MILKNFQFFDSQDPKSESGICENTNCAADSATIEVANVAGASPKITAWCLVARDYFPVSVFSISDFSVVSEITEEGIYQIPLSGVLKVKLMNAGGACDCNGILPDMDGTM